MTDAAAKTLDPVTLAVLKGRLEQIVDEMDATLYRSAFNPTIAEAKDACHGIYDPVPATRWCRARTVFPFSWAPWRLRSGP